MQCSSTALVHAQAIPLTEEVMALATDHAPLGLPGLGLKLRTLTLDPAQLAHHRQAHGFVINRQRRGHTHAPLRWINA